MLIACREGLHVTGPGDMALATVDILRMLCFWGSIVAVAMTTEAGITAFIGSNIMGNQGGISSRPRRYGKT
ncbi:hypothetical protein B5V00_13115 [Geothermobacter hydrogeniphilus]|uniref:Uncharacterized protein n=1 Tax=Geothermobacter hydrogeniphilus TaxID=1969733 RepID=A0A1X0XX94_9BACT|nr:hypothetical protein B5V00_13115 [Geothermobacter hydrogeniphilus]